MTDTVFTEIVNKNGLNVYFVAKGDREMNIREEKIVPANPCCNCYSIAKAFCVTAVGILYDRGLLKPEDKVVSFFPDLIPDGIDEKWADVTLHDVLLHKIGFGRGLLDIDADDASLYTTRHYLDIVFREKLVHTPGTVYQYTDAAYYLVSRIIERVSGEDVCKLLRPILMETMNFKELAWSTCPEGYSMGATGLYIRTEDLVKLGILYLRRGDWNGTRIISEEWVDMVLDRGYELKPKGNGWYGKGGMRGQMLIFNPEKNIAVAWHAYGKVPYETMIPDTVENQ